MGRMGYTRPSKTEIDKDVEVKVNYYIDLDWDVRVDVDKNFRVQFDTDLFKLEGNSSVVTWDIESHSGRNSPLPWPYNNVNTGGDTEFDMDVIANVTAGRSSVSALSFGQGLSYDDQGAPTYENWGANILAAAGAGTGEHAIHRPILTTFTEIAFTYHTDDRATISSGEVAAAVDIDRGMILAS